ncbi:MAG: hypothetical protein M0Z95_16555 [Actinomycetota bacterium]|jgi:hypothetical protein|nr:hypothetical protein [Actinomycetota bacterium]
MIEDLIDGTFVLEGDGGIELTERQAGRLRWTTADDGHWIISFLTSHQFHLPGGAAQAVWLRFDDGTGRTLMRQPMGVQSEVTMPAVRPPV